MGIRNITTGDTLSTPDIDVCLEPPTFPEPVISMAIEPDSKADQEKMAGGLQALAEEDPTFKCYTDEETGQTLVAGMGELHLEIIRDRLKREFKVQAQSGAPQIAYRETITAAAEVAAFSRSNPVVAVSMATPRSPSSPPSGAAVWRWKTRLWVA